MDPRDKNKPVKEIKQDKWFDEEWVDEKYDDDFDDDFDDDYEDDDDYYSEDR